MSNRLLHHLILTIFILIITALVLFIIYKSKISSQLLLEAEQNYKKAVEAPTPFQRGLDLNQTLSIYSSLEAEHQPIHGNGKLYYNLAQTYFDLEQYPWAVFYDYQAKALMPRNPNVDLHLREALKKLNIAFNENDSIFKKVFFFHYYLSLPERLQILFLCTLLIFATMCLYIWKANLRRFLRGLIMTMLFVGSVFLGSVLYSKYMEPLEGVIVKATMLYRDDSFQVALVDPKPLLEGVKVEVLDVEDSGKWLKIRSAERTLGFIPSDVIQIIKK